jgi:transcriptional antiterminator RfaH
MITDWAVERRGRTGIPRDESARAGRATRVSSRGAEEVAWRVLHTRSRQEKAVAEALFDAGATPFLPVISRVMHYGHRRRTVKIPVFPGYVFAWGTRGDAFDALRARRAVSIVPVPDQATLEFELAQIRRAIDGDARLSPYRFLARGVRVRVTSGPFKDLEGIVDESGRRDRLVLRIQALGRATSLEIDSCLLERADQHSREHPNEEILQIGPTPLVLGFFP